MITERSSKCHLYKHITTTFCIQKYLTKCLPINIRKAITKIRCFFRQYFIGFGTSTITYVNHFRKIWLVVLVRSH